MFEYFNITYELDQLIERMFENGIFDLEEIAKMCQKINENNDFNYWRIFRKIVRYSERYIKSHDNDIILRNLAIKNTLDLIKKTHESCNFVVTKPDTDPYHIFEYDIELVPEDEVYILNETIDTGITEIISEIIKLNPQKNKRTLACAVMTQNIEIIQTVWDYGASVNYSTGLNNTFTQGALAGNQIIMIDIMKKGARPPESYLCGMEYWDSEEQKYVSLDSDTFGTYWKKNSASNESHEKIDVMINLIMCGGALISDKLYHEIFDKKIKSHICTKILHCYYLLNKNKLGKTFEKEITGSMESMEQINQLKEDLIKTMDMLTNDPLIKQQTMGQINTGTHGKIILPLIEIIYEYQVEESKVKYIDWSKY